MHACHTLQHTPCTAYAAGPLPAEGRPPVQQGGTWATVHYTCTCYVDGMLLSCARPAQEASATAIKISMGTRSAQQHLSAPISRGSGRPGTAHGWSPVVVNRREASTPNPSLALNTCPPRLNPSLGCVRSDNLHLPELVAQLLSAPPG